MENVGDLGFDLYNLNRSEFNPDMYLLKTIRDCGLTQLMAKEYNINKEICSLQGNMQTLVYNNYNKFISATDTITKMKLDFKTMEDEMSQLSKKMVSIDESSEQILNGLQKHRDQISTLYKKHLATKKFQVLFELTSTLKRYVASNAFSQAVNHYLNAQKFLDQHAASFERIRDESNDIIEDLKVKLRERFEFEGASQEELIESVTLLTHLKEPRKLLYTQFLRRSEMKLDSDLSLLNAEVKMTKINILEFVELTCKTFLKDISFMIDSYGGLFLNEVEQERPNDLDSALKTLGAFVISKMVECFELVELKISEEVDNVEDEMLVSALDSFYRRVQTLDRLIPEFEFCKKFFRIIYHASKTRCEYHLQGAKECFKNCLNSTMSTIMGKEDKNELTDLLTDMETSFTDNFESMLLNLTCFIREDFAFPGHFRQNFCKHFIREGITFPFLKYINLISLDLCQAVSGKLTVPPSLLLLLSKFFFNLTESSKVKYISLADQYFAQPQEEEASKTEVDACSQSRNTAQRLLDEFVRIRGAELSQLIRKSVEVRNWLHATEPRHVRCVVKIVIQDMTAIGHLVGQFYETINSEKDKNSDSSKRSYSTGRRTPKTRQNFRQAWTENALLSTIQNLFSDKIEVFSQVKFTTESVLNAILKISLKSFQECVRLKVFNVYGLQQMQVDIQYLQWHLCQILDDEDLVLVLLDEVLNSCIHRTLQPVLMERSIVDVICHGASNAEF